MSVRHTWAPGAARTACGLRITARLKMRQADAARTCKRCVAAKRRGRS
jgi:hypothetical protein